MVAAAATEVFERGRGGRYVDSQLRRDALSAHLEYEALAALSESRSSTGSERAAQGAAGV